MNISNTISPVAATNPVAGTSDTSSRVKSAILAGRQTGDAATAGQLGAASSQAATANKLLSSLGQNVDMRG